MNVAGNMKPWPILVGRRKIKYAQSGIRLCIKDSATVPTSMRNAPATNGGLRFLDQVMRNPVAVPAVDAAIEGTIRRSPEEVADSSNTAWK